MSVSGLDRWYSFMRSHDRAMLWDLLHPEAVFESPVVHAPQRGREIVFKYLTTAEKVLGGPGFAYKANGAAKTVRCSNSRTRSRASKSMAST